MIRRMLAAAVIVLLAAGLAVALTTSGGRPAAAEPPLAGTDYPIPDRAVFVATTGSDTAAGTRTAPLRTLTAAVAAAPAGGTVVLRGGTYRERVGTVRKRLTVQPYPGERVWLKGSLLVDEWERVDSREGRAWEHRGWNPGLCADCYLPEIIDPAHPMAGSPQMAFVDGRPLREVANRAAVGPGRFYAGEGAVVIGDDPAGHRVELTAYDHLLQFDGAAAGSRLRGIGVAQYGSNQHYGARGAMVVVNAEDVTVERMSFVRSASTGLAVFQPGGRVSGSKFTDNGLVGLLANRADDLRVTGSTFDGNNAERFAVGGPAVGAAGAKVTHTKRPSFSGNRFTGNHATGWWCDLGCTDATVSDNVASGNRGHGMHYEVSSRAVIGSNELARNGGHGLKVSSSDRVRITGNSFTGNRAGSLGLYNDPRDPGFDPYSEQLGLSWLTEGLVIEDNRFTQRADRPVIVSADHKPQTAGNPAFVARADRDTYRRAGGQAPLVVLVTGDGRRASFDNLAQLRAATGFERNGVQERP